MVISGLALLCINDMSPCSLVKVSVWWYLLLLCVCVCVTVSGTDEVSLAPPHHSTNHSTEETHTSSDRTTASILTHTHTHIISLHTGQMTSRRARVFPQMVVHLHAERAESAVFTHTYSHCSFTLCFCYFLSIILRAGGVVREWRGGDSVCYFWHSDIGPYNLK